MVARAKKTNPSGKGKTAASQSDADKQSNAEDAAAATADDMADTPEATAKDADPVPSDVGSSDESSAASEDVEKAVDPADGTVGNDAVQNDAENDRQSQKEAKDGTEAIAVHPVPVPVEPERRSGFWPLVLGGVVAGLIGFAISELDLFGTRDAGLDVSRLTTEVSDQGQRIATLEEATPDMTPVEALKSELADLGGALTGLEDRIATLEKRPIAVTADTGEADAYAEELARLQASVEEQRDEIEGLLQNALSVEEATAEAARASAAQSAMARIVSAIDSGQPYDAPVDALQTIDGLEVPQTLIDTAPTGVVTLADLQTRFPDNARAALSAARAGAPEEESGGFGGFLKRQLGARSVAPREGADADAVLSRAEDAVRNGRLSDALAEIVTLPEIAQTTMEDWLADAQARHAAQQAADTMAQRLTTN